MSEFLAVGGFHRLPLALLAASLFRRASELIARFGTDASFHLIMTILSFVAVSMLLMTGVEPLMLMLSAISRRLSRAGSAIGKGDVSCSAAGCCSIQADDS